MNLLLIARAVLYHLGVGTGAILLCCIVMSIVLLAKRICEHSLAVSMQDSHVDGFDLHTYTGLLTLSYEIVIGQ